MALMLSSGERLEWENKPKVEARLAVSMLDRPRSQGFMPWLASREGLPTR